MSLNTASVPRPSVATLVAPLILVGAFAVPFLYFERRSVAVLAVAGLLVLALLAMDKAALAILALPGVLLTQRVGGAISLSDVVLTAAGLTAVAAQAPRWLSPQARLLLRCFAIYLGLVGVSVIVSPEVRGVLALLQRVALVAGSVCVGAWLVRTGRVTVALRLLVAGMASLAAAAVLTSISTGFAPAYALGYHKNFTGSVLATTLTVLLIAPAAFRLSPAVRAGAVALLAAGVLAAQSRGAYVALLIAFLVWVVRAPTQTRRRYLPVAVIAAGAMGFLLYSSVTSQLALDDRHDSIDQRVEVETATRELWLANPIAGVGPRYYKTSGFVGYQPPNNVVNETLAESGFVGLLGFVVLVAGSAVACWRSQGQLALAATCVLLGRFGHGLLDIYWTAGTTTLPWLITGLGLAGAGAAVAQRSREPAVAGTA